MPVLPLAPTEHLLFDGTSDHLPCSRICVLACLPGLGTVLLVAPAPVSHPFLCSDLDHLPDSSALLQGPGPATSLAS